MGARSPITLRLCLAGPGWGGGRVHGKGRQAAKGWWIWTRGARREGQGSREGFPLGWRIPSLPTRMRQVPDPVLALSAALEWGWSGRCLCVSREQKSMHGHLWDTESVGGQAPSRQGPRLPPGKLSWISRSIGPSIELTGVCPRKSWARPHLLPQKVRPQQSTRTHPLPLDPALLSLFLWI